MKHLNYLLVAIILTFSIPSFSQKTLVKDSVIYNIKYRDTVIYRYDTVQLKTYIFSDTISKGTTPTQSKRKSRFLPNNWGIGPSVGAYYSPFNGFDVNIGFGIQYYLLAIPGFRNPHLGHRKNRRNFTQ